jgi:hypothetical protein
MLIHLANIFFETDLCNFSTFEDKILSHPNFFQLQYLPVIYRKKNEWLAVSDLPESNVQDCTLIKHLEKKDDFKIEPWGISQAIVNFAKDVKKINHYCNLELIQKLSSKIFTYPYTKKFLPGSFLLQPNDNNIKQLYDSKYPFVLKNPEGFSGRGHAIFLQKPTTYDNFLEKIKILLPSDHLIQEPWLNRTVDFSTQWLISNESITCLGATILKNSKGGTYQGNLFNPQDPFLKKTYPQIEEHYNQVFMILKDMQELNFKGHCGIDGFFYEKNNKTFLQPLVEINPRKTMGYVTLAYAKNHAIDDLVSIELLDQKKCSRPQLPLELKVGPRLIKFKKNLEINFFKKN